MKGIVVMMNYLVFGLTRTGKNDTKYFPAMQRMLLAMLVRGLKASGREACQQREQSNCQHSGAAYFC